MSSSDEAEARITEGIARAAKFLGEVFDDPSLLDDIPGASYVIVADDVADEARMVDVAARMTAAEKPATVYRLGRTQSSQWTGSEG